MIDLGRDYINTKYEYSKLLYIRRGYNFKNTEARKFMGMNFYDYEPDYQTPVVNSPDIRKILKEYLQLQKKIILKKKMQIIYHI